MILVCWFRLALISNGGGFLFVSLIDKVNISGLESRFRVKIVWHRMTYSEYRITPTPTNFRIRTTGEKKWKKIWSIKEFVLYLY